MARKIKSPAINKIIKLSVSDIDTNFKALSDSLGSIAQADILQGQTLIGVRLEANEWNYIQHGLSRPATGFIIVRNNKPVIGAYWVDSLRPKHEFVIGWTPPAGDPTTEATVSIYVY